MSIFYRILIVLLIIAASYTLFGIGHFKWMYSKVNNPSATFQVQGNQNADITLVEFINYGCGYCKDLHPTIQELLQIRKDLRYVVRPVIFSEEDTAYKITSLAFAAGLQGKFDEIHGAFLEYPENVIPDDFIEETALLYGVDYDQMVTDSQGKKVKKIIKENLSAFEHVGLQSVPSFMIKDKIYVVTNEELPDLQKLLNMISSAEQ